MAGNRLSKQASNAVETTMEKEERKTKVNMDG
jgi:hypothetical protein